MARKDILIDMVNFNNEIIPPLSGEGIGKWIPKRQKA